MFDNSDGDDKREEDRLRNDVKRWGIRMQERNNKEILNEES